MTPPLDELYFVWLYSQVANPDKKNPSLTYWRTLKTMHCTEFVWTVPNDDNRLEDGKDLRYEFVDQSGLMDVDPGWIRLGCSMLELLIGLSRRLSFEAGGESRDWFWDMMRNLDFDSFTDKHPAPEGHVEGVLERIIWRTYDADGRRGIFPLNNPTQDQRHVELWYQLNAYVLERI